MAAAEPSAGQCCGGGGRRLSARQPPGRRWHDRRVRSLVLLFILAVLLPPAGVDARGRVSWRTRGRALPAPSSGGSHSGEVGMRPSRRGRRGMRLLRSVLRRVHTSHRRCLSCSPDEISLALRRLLRPRPEFDAPVCWNSHVGWWMTFFSKGRGRNYLRAWLRRSGRYVADLRRTLGKAGLPKDLAYLVAVESGFNHRVLSSANAHGLWQIIPALARRQGLRVDRWVDERRNTEKATKAVIGYLKDLHAEFRSWLLVAAAYNGGPTRLRRALKRLSVRTFWELTRFEYLPSETLKYVPRWLALTMIMREPGRYGFGKVGLDPPLLGDLVDLKEPVPLRWAAAAAGTTVDRLRTLNPELISWATPPGKAPYRLRVPVGAGAGFPGKLAKLLERKRLRFRAFRAVPGTNLHRLARRAKVPPRVLLALNTLSGRVVRRRAKHLLLPVPFQTCRETARSFEERCLKQRGAARCRRCRRLRRSFGRIERSLGRLARTGSKKRLSRRRRRRLVSRRRRVARSLRRCRSRCRSRGRRSCFRRRRKVVRRCRAGWRRRVVRVASLVRKQHKKARKRRFGRRWMEYRVRRGDSLWAISRRFGVSVRELRRWNRVGRGSHIHPGDRLLLRPGGGSGRGRRSLRSLRSLRRRRRAKRLRLRRLCRRVAGWRSRRIPRYHTLRRGQTLRGVSRRYGISLKRLGKYNVGKRLRPGVLIRLRPRRVTYRKIKHTVRRGETLRSIAACYEVETTDVLDDGCFRRGRRGRYLAPGCKVRVRVADLEGQASKR